MLRYIIVTFICLMMVVACTSQTHREHNPDELLEVNRNIDAQLQDLSLSTGSVRTVVRQFHEGETDFLGNKEIVVSEQYVYEAPGFALLVRESDISNIPISWLQQTITQMWTEDGLSCYTFLIEELQNSQIKALLKLHGIQQIAGCPIVNKSNGAPIGTLSVAFREPLDAKQNIPMLQATEATAENIETLLGEKRGE